jgi:very-short-patch-repair endonuclease
MHSLSPARAVGTVDRAIARLAAAQYGVVSRQQLVALGVSVHAIKWRLRTSRLHPVHRGVYLVGHSEPPELAREMAAQLACGPRALISHQSAARLDRLLPLPNHVHVVDITVVGGDARPRPGLRVHTVRTLLRRDVVHHGPLRLTSPARTLLDLAAVLSDGQLEVAVAQARRRGRATDAQLQDQLARNAGRRGAGRLRRLLALERGPAFTRSKAERLMLALVRRANLPVPETNVFVGGYELDFLWRTERVVVETDGRAWHSDPLAFETDRRRDAELAALGYLVTRVTWRHLVDEPDQVAWRLRRALEGRATAPRGRSGLRG